MVPPLSCSGKVASIAESALSDISDRDRVVLNAMAAQG